MWYGAGRARQAEDRADDVEDRHGEEGRVVVLPAGEPALAHAAREVLVDPEEAPRLCNEFLEQCKTGITESGELPRSQLAELK